MFIWFSKIFMIIDNVKMVGGYSVINISCMIMNKNYLKCLLFFV